MGQNPKGGFAMRKKVTVWGEVGKGFKSIGKEIGYQVFKAGTKNDRRKKVNKKPRKKSKYVYW